MRIVKFMDGTNAVWVVPSEVSSLQQVSATKTKIRLKDGTTYTVDLANADVAAALATDVQ